MTGLTRSLQNPRIPLILLTQTASARCSRHVWAAARPVGIHQNQRPLSSMKVFWNAVKESSSSPTLSSSIPSNVSKTANTTTPHSAPKGSLPAIFRTGMVNPQITPKIWETEPLQRLKSFSEEVVETASGIIQPEKPKPTASDTKSTTPNPPQSTQAPTLDIAPETDKVVNHAPQAWDTVPIQTEADDARVEVGQAELKRAIEAVDGIDPDSPFITFKPKFKNKTKKAIKEEHIPKLEYEPRPPRTQKHGPSPAIISRMNGSTGAVRWSPPTAVPKISIGDYFSALDERKLEDRERERAQMQRRNGPGLERGEGEKDQWRQPGRGTERMPSSGDHRGFSYKESANPIDNRSRSRDASERRPAHGNQRDSTFRVRNDSEFGTQRGGREVTESRPIYGGQRTPPHRERYNREMDNQRGGRYNSERDHNSYTPQHRPRPDSTRNTPMPEERTSYASRSGSRSGSGWNKGGSTFGSGGSAQRSSGSGYSGPRRRYYSTQVEASTEDQISIKTTNITRQASSKSKVAKEIRKALQYQQALQTYSNKIFTTKRKYRLFRTVPINQSQIFSTFRIFQGRIWKTNHVSKIWKTNLVGPVFKTIPAMPRKPKIWSTSRAVPFETKIWDTIPVDLAVPLKIAQKLGIKKRSSERSTPLDLPPSRRIAIKPPYRKDTAKDWDVTPGTKIWNTVTTPKTWGEIPRPINYNPGGDPITLFFRTYFPEFDFNHRARYMSEWNRLWRSRGWHMARENIAKYSRLVQKAVESGTASPEELQSLKDHRTKWKNTLTYALFARRLFRIAMVKAFRVDFGGPLRDNLAWQKLCDQAGVKLFWNDPLSCAKAIASKMIPLVDIHEDYRINALPPTPAFDNTDEYFKYCLQHQKFFEPSLLANIAVNIPEKEPVSEILLCLISQRSAADSISPWQKKINKLHHDRQTIRQNGAVLPVPVEKKAKYVSNKDELDTDRQLQSIIVRRYGEQDGPIRIRGASAGKMMRQEQLRAMTMRMREEAQRLKEKARKKLEWDRIVEKRREETRLKVLAKNVERKLEPRFSVLPVKQVPSEIVKMLGEKAQNLK